MGPEIVGDAGMWGYFSFGAGTGALTTDSPMLKAYDAQVAAAVPSCFTS